MPRTAHLANVYPLPPEVPLLSARERAELDMIELLRGLDPDSQRVLVEQLDRTLRAVRPYSRTARLLSRRVAWKHRSGLLWLVAPTSRRYLYQQAHA